MKKKLFTLLFTVMASIGIMHAYIIDGTCGDNLTWSFNTDDYTLTIEGSGDMYDFDNGSSPWNINYSSYIKYVTLPEGLTKIGNGAFGGNSYLTTIEIPNNVTSIGKSAFSGCSGLTSVSIPYKVIGIGDHAFSGCYGLTSVVIGNNVTSIGDYAFLDCSGLTSINIPNSVTSIGISAFYNCNSLPIINNIRYADTYLIEAPNKTLSTYTLKGNTRWIGEGAFFDCTSLASIEIPNSVIRIGGRAFSNCTSLTSIEIPNRVESIGESAFLYCTNLTSIEIPNSVTSIGFGAFHGCEKLTSVIIGEGVESFAGTVFQSTALTSVVWKAKNCAVAEREQNLPFYDVSWSITSFTFGDNVISIPNFLCSHMSQLTSVTIPNSVKTIGDMAFFECTGLTSISLGNSVEDIGVYAFYNCNQLNSLTIPNSVQTIGGYAFSNCDRLTMLDIPNSVTTIGEGAFSNCDDLYSVTIGEGVRSMGAKCFNESGPVRVKWNAINCADFSSRFYSGYSGKFTLGDKVEHIPAYLCAGMKLDKITLPASVTSIGVHAFDVFYGDIIIYATTPPSCFITSFPLETPIYVPTESFNTYKSDEIWGEFNIKSMDTYEATEEVQFQNDKSNKLFRDGQILILHDDKTYTVTGQEVR